MTRFIRSLYARLNARHGDPIVRVQNEEGDAYRAGEYDMKPRTAFSVLLRRAMSAYLRKKYPGLRYVVLFLLGTAAGAATIYGIGWLLERKPVEGEVLAIGWVCTSSTHMRYPSAFGGERFRTVNRTLAGQDHKVECPREWRVGSLVDMKPQVRTKKEYFAWIKTSSANSSSNRDPLINQ